MVDNDKQHEDEHHTPDIVQHLRHELVTQSFQGFEKTTNTKETEESQHLGRLNNARECGETGEAAGLVVVHGEGNHNTSPIN